MGSSPIITEFVFLALLAYLLRRLALLRTSSLPLPPGPRGLPIVKNLFDWPKSKEWETLAQWAQQYGDMVHVNIAGKHIVAVNSVDLAIDLLQVKGAIYSDRPSLYVAGELIGFNKITALMNHDKKLKESRRMFVQEIGTKQASARFEAMMQTHIQRFIDGLLADPKFDTPFFVRLFTLTSGMILEATYGYDIHDHQDKLLSLGLQTVKDITISSRPGAYIIDIFPWIDRVIPNWFPFTGYRKEIIEARKRFEEFRDTPFSYVENHISTNEVVQRSFVARQLQSQALTAEQQDNLRNTAATSFGAGSDTTVGAMNHFFFFMTKYPMVQAKAKEEIDRVVGNSRLPSLSDQADMPYVNALIKEILRCGPIAPMGMAHQLCVDDVHNGMLIPKGSVIIPNIWMMSRDERYYKNPLAFDPTRFLGDKPEMDPSTFLFGFGRRICTGRVFANQSLFLAVTALLAALRISKQTDESGAEIEPSMNYHIEGLNMHLGPFAMKVEARYPQL